MRTYKHIRNFESLQQEFRVQNCFVYEDLGKKIGKFFEEIILSAVLQRLKVLPEIQIFRGEYIRLESLK